MKPITNIILIATLICYVFMPFYTIELTGNITGIEYSTGLITENFSFLKTLFALLPFISCFAAIAFNCMKNRYWGLVAGTFIILGIVFFIGTGTPHNLPLTHDPNVITADPQEGLTTRSVAYGYDVSYILMWASLVSCIISLMPFKFNTVLERKIDNQLDKVDHEIHDNWKKIESKAHITHHKAKAGKVAEAPSEPQPPKFENPADYMPPGSTANPQPAKLPNADTNPSDGTNPDAPYMPKGDWQN